MGRDMVVSRYAIPTGIPRIDKLSMGPPGFGVSQSSSCDGRSGGGGWVDDCPV